MESPADLTAALATIPVPVLHILGVTIDDSPNIVAGLLARLGAAVDWEIDRRAGMFHPLLGPRAAIDDSETDASRTVLAILALCFRSPGQGESKPVAEFLEKTASTLCAELERPETLQ